MAIAFRSGSSTVPHESLVYFLILPCHPSYVTFFKCRTMNATSLGISCPLWSGRRVRVMPKVFVRLLPSPSSHCLLCVCMLRHFSHAQLFVTPWTVAFQAPLSIGFSGQESWSMLPCPPPRCLPDPGLEPVSPASAGGFFTTSDT